MAFFLYLCDMQFSYPKNEKLKSHKTINRLFSEGKSVSKYPLRLVYVENTDENNSEKQSSGSPLREDDGGGRVSCSSSTR